MMPEKNTRDCWYLILPIMLLSLFGISIARGEDALRPRTHGDWGHDDAPMPAYQNCHPALTECQLPVRPLTKEESSLNERAVSGEQVGTPAPPLGPNGDEKAGSEIGKDSSLNKNSSRSESPVAR